MWLVIGLIVAVLLAIYLDHREKHQSVKSKDVKELPTYSTGHEYEYFVAAYLKRKGYKNITITPKSGDYGADIICADNSNNTIAVQCKLYNKPVGYKAIEEVVSGMHYYRCNKAMVVTNTTYTKQAKEAAAKIGITLLENVCLNEAENISNNKATTDKKTPVRYRSPGGQYYRLYQDMLDQKNLLVTGSSEDDFSSIINGIIYTSLLGCPDKAGFIIIDSNERELYRYSPCPHILTYVTEPNKIIKSLEIAIAIINRRLGELKTTHDQIYTGCNLYVIINRLNRIPNKHNEQFIKLLQQICTCSSALRVRTIIITDSNMLNEAYDGIFANFTSRVGLHTNSEQDSIKAIFRKGCEQLPSHGQGFYLTPDSFELYNIPKYSNDQIKTVLDHWTSDACRI